MLKYSVHRSDTCDTCERVAAARARARAWASVSRPAALINVSHWTAIVATQINILC